MIMLDAKKNHFADREGASAAQPSDTPGQVPPALSQRLAAPPRPGGYPVVPRAD